MILDEIIAFKKHQLQQEKRISVRELEELISPLPGTRDFTHAINKREGQLKLIAEVKQASPSKGLIAKDFCPATIAQGYATGGAAAISVLTETKYFLGSKNDLKAVKEATSLPVLRKDFIVDPYQIMESRAIGADAILLIAAVMSKKDMVSYLSLANDVGLHTLVEVHNRQELEMALEAEATIIGINNRNLQTFAVDIDTTFALLSMIPSGKIIVSESGITHANIKYLKDTPVDAVLVGETLVRTKNRFQAVKELLA